MPDTEKLGKMLDNLINKKDSQAEVHFHDYLQGKMQEVVHGEDIQPDELENTDKEE